MADYDLIIMGGGPAGYLSAERAGALGASVLLIEDRAVGGICLNEGCIPTKTLLHGAKLYHQAYNGRTFGVTAEAVRYDLSAAMTHKAKTVQALTKGVSAQLNRHGVEVKSGHALLRGPGRVELDGVEFTADKVLLATGGMVSVPPITGLEPLREEQSGDTGRRAAVMTSREILEIETLPRSLIVIGGGYIGMEFASYFAGVGVDVTVVEMMTEIIPMLEPELAASLRKMVPGVTYKLGRRVSGVEDRAAGGDTGAAVQIQSAESGETETLEADVVLVAAGRKPRVRGCGFEAAGLDFDDKGVKVDEYMQTNLPGVYAAGDVTGKVLLAHAAYRMGEVAVAHMFRDRVGRDQPGTSGSGSGGPPATPASGRATWPNRMRYRAVPWVVFTMPEVAGCGLNPSEAREAGYTIATGRLPLKVSGRYLAEHPRERGTITITADRETGRLLGVQLLGTGVGELIHSVAAMIEQELRIQDIREIIFPHPTVSEALRDAAWAIEL